ncbi:hypothetical protein [Ferruginibacter sp.]
MNKRRKTYTFFQNLSAIFLILTLLWLTASTPFVLTAQQQQAKQQKSTVADTGKADCEDCTNEDGSNSNNVEEKAPSSINFAEEFLHEHHVDHHFFSVRSLYHKLENADSYTAFHGELLVPPPNAA